MDSSFYFEIQQFTRKKWKTVSSSPSLSEAHAIAHRHALLTLERVRVVRKETHILTHFYYSR